MLTKTYSAAVAGVDALPVEVEVNATGRGDESNVSIVGLPDAAIKESRDRIRSALQSCGYGHPKGSTLVNLAPADMRKEGSSFDLPIALSLIAANGLLPREETRRSPAEEAGQAARSGEQKEAMLSRHCGDEKNKKAMAP